MLSQQFFFYFKQRQAIYAVQVWRSYKQKDIENIERVQRRAIRMIEDLQSDPYHIRLKKICLISLEIRRLRADLIEVFKMMSGMEGLSFESLFQVNIRHSMKLDKQRISRDCKKNFFSQRITNEWNALPENAVTSKIVNQFKKEIASLFNLRRSNFRSQ